MIQKSINQLLTTAGLAARLSPSYENRQAAKSIYAKGIAAETGLKDIAKSIKRVESGKRPAYSNAELEDIERRVDEHVHNIGTLKTAAIPGQETAPYIPTNKRGRVEGLGTRKSYSKRLQGIESRLSAMKEKAMQSMTDKASAALEQDKDFKETMSLIKQIESEEE